MTPSIYVILLILCLLGTHMPIVDAGLSEHKHVFRDRCLIGEVKENSHMMPFLSSVLEDCFSVERVAKSCEQQNSMPASHDCWCQSNGDCPTRPLISRIDHNTHLKAHFVNALQEFTRTPSATISCNPFRAFADQLTGCSNASYEAIDMSECKIQGLSFDGAAQPLTQVSDVTQDIFAFGDTVCALVDISSETRTYRSRTQTLSRAHADNSLILHSGECGVCSSTQDLSVYLQGVDLSRVGTRCAVKMGLWDKVSWKCKAYMRPGSRSDQEDELNRDILDREMVDCWRQANTGLTDECIKIWAWDSISAACGECKDSCMNDRDLHCLRYSTDSGQLCPCLQCDHQCYDPIFTKFTGLTRRRAGLPSEVPRPCNAVFTETWIDRSIVKPPALPSHSPTRQNTRREEQQRQETEEIALRSSVSANYYAPVCNVSSYGFSSHLKSIRN